VAQRALKSRHLPTIFVLTICAAVVAVLACRELRIGSMGRRLRTPCEVSFHNERLASVLTRLSQACAVPISLDETGLAGEGVTVDTPVTLDLHNEVMTKSVLNLVLEPQHLDYYITPAGIVVTSERDADARRGSPWRYLDTPFHSLWRWLYPPPSPDW
jgi:hypothetical protein